MEQTESHSTSRGYYCHKCNTTISNPVANFHCPRCNLGFIEKIPDGSSSTSLTDRNNREADHHPMDVLNNVLEGISNNLGVFIQSSNQTGSGTSESRPTSSNRRDMRRPRRPERSRRETSQETFEQILGEFLSNMTRTATQNMEADGPVLLVGNPGDYAWGHEGLDTIVTQLLNQMDSSGPPPLAKDKIKELPFVSITPEQASENIQCSVCWDTFKISENVRQLPCEHIYHDICIVPWLELHGTCPVCRKLLSEDGDGRLGFSHSGSLEALLRAAATSNRSNTNVGSSSSNSSSSSSSGGSSSSSSSSSSNSSSGQFLDYD